MTFCILYSTRVDDERNDSNIKSWWHHGEEWFNTTPMKTPELVTPVKDYEDSVNLLPLAVEDSSEVVTSSESCIYTDNGNGNLDNRSSFENQIDQDSYHLEEGHANNVQLNSMEETSVGTSTILENHSSSVDSSSDSKEERSSDFWINSAEVEVVVDEEEDSPTQLVTPHLLSNGENVIVSQVFAGFFLWKYISNSCVILCFLM
jgi:hypothetical protein